MRLTTVAIALVVGMLCGSPAAVHAQTVEVGSFPIPVTIVPGDLSDEAIDALS